MDIKDLLVKYNDYLKYELNYSEHTIKEYFLHIDKFFLFLKERNIKVEKVTKPDIILYLKYLDEKEIAKRSVANILSALRNFYDFLMDKKIVVNNVFRSVHNPKLDKKLPNFLSYEDMRTLLDGILVKDFLTARNKMLIELFYATGMRVSEVVNLKKEDINYNDLSIRVLGKGKKERIVYFGKPALRAIQVYEEYNPYDSPYLVLNNKGNKITARGVELIIDKVCFEACLKGNVTPHTFRHTFATHLLNNGADIKSVGELLGHSSLNTTEVYTHITSDFLKSEYLKRMPRR